MSEQPFEEKAVLWRWKPRDEDRKDGRRMLAMIYAIIRKSGHSSLERNGFDVYHKWYPETDWVISQGSEGAIIAELLRQLQESQARVAELEVERDEALAMAKRADPAPAMRQMLDEMKQHHAEVLKQFRNAQPEKEQG